MKIVITGGGEVGYHLAKMLAGENQDIYLIDQNKKRLAYIESHIDVFTIFGDATSIEVLKEAKIEQCDLIIGVTSSEETNLLVSILAKKFGAKRSIARINNQELLLPENLAIYHGLGVDHLISPVQLAAQEIKSLVLKSAFTDNLEFEGGKLSVIGISVGDASPLKNQTIKESAHLNPNLTFKPFALHRKEQTIIVKGDTKILENDILYFVTNPESIDLIMNICDQQCFDIKDIMILGGSSIGLAAAQLLEKDYRVILVEKDTERCNTIAGKLKNTLVVNIDGRDVKALEEEGLGDMDAFVAVTADSESNIMSSLVAKNHDVKKNHCAC